jgi:glycosyltransferase involved in cell wall biosynthesis
LQGPEISVVVPSHARRLRLWWLLNALEEQTLSRDRFEVIVVHDYDDEVSSLFERHPLGSGAIRFISIEPGTGGPGIQRNIGWRHARAPLVAFTDDDCRPEPHWLAELHAAHRQEGDDAFLQGATRPDPLEVAIFAAPHSRTLEVIPPNLFAQTCNIAYPRSLLAELNGFDEALITSGEDTDLAYRARDTGARQVAVPAALVWHAVDEVGLRGAVRAARRWGTLPLVLRKHPQLRDSLPLGIFWRASHAEYYAALAGLVMASRWRPAALLVLPYLRRALSRRGHGKRARLASAVELPGRVTVDTAEVVTMARGSVRYRVPML